MKFKVNDSYKGKNSYSLALILLPMVLMLFLMLLMVDHIGLDLLIPVWNDEVGWWGFVGKLAKGVSYPGHTGYNGQYAPIGNFGPWGLAPLLPYALFGRIFGWKLHSMAVANMLFLGLALFLFANLIKADKKTVGKIALVYVGSYITIGYSMTSMSEGSRYSITVILCGVLIYLKNHFFELKNHKTKNVYLAIIIAFLMYAINAWLILALFIPLICWEIMRKFNLIIKVVVIPVVTVVVSMVEMHIVGLFSYTYTESIFQKMINAYKNGGARAALRFVISNLFTNLNTISLPTILRNGNDTLVMYFLLYTIVIVVCVWRATLYRNYYDYLALYLLLGFLIGYCTLYTGSDWTLCRGTNAGLLAAMLCLCLGKDQKNLFKIFGIGALVSIVVVFNYFSGLLYERGNTYQHLEKVMEERKALSEVIDISPYNEPWDNTVAEYGGTDFWYLALPEGAHGNYMVNGEINKDARYVIIKSDDPNKQTVVDEHVENGHSVLYEDEIFVVLKRN